MTALLAARRALAGRAWLLAIPVAGLAYLGTPWLAALSPAAAAGTLLVQVRPAAELRRLAVPLALLATLVGAAVLSAAAHPSASTPEVLGSLVASCAVAVIVASGSLDDAVPVVAVLTAVTVTLFVLLAISAPQELAAKSPLGAVFAGLRPLTALGGSTLHPNLVGIAASLLTAAWLAVALVTAGAGARAAAWAAFGGVVVVLVLSGSRGSWVAAACGCAGLLLVAGRRRALAGAGCLGLAAVAIAWAAHVDVLGLAETALRDVLRIDSPDVSRVTLWAGTLSSLRDSPWLGRGMGSFPLAYPDTRIPLVNAHDTYLQMWLELGLPGLAAVVALTAYSAVRSLRRLASERLALVPFGLVVTWSAVSVTESTVLTAWRPWLLAAPLDPPVPGRQPWEGWHETVVPLAFMVWGLAAARRCARAGEDSGRERVHDGRS